MAESGRVQVLPDLVGHWDPRWVEIEALVAKLERWRPEWLAFTSKAVAHEAARALGVRRPAEPDLVVARPRGAGGGIRRSRRRVTVAR